MSCYVIYQGNTAGPYPDASSAINNVMADAIVAETATDGQLLVLDTDGGCEGWQVTKTVSRTSGPGNDTRSFTHSFTWTPLDA